MKKVIFVALFFMLVLASGCTEITGQLEEPYYDNYGENFETSIMDRAPSPMKSASADYSEVVGSGQRMIIKKGSAEVEVIQNQLEQKLADLKVLISQNNGTLENISYYSTESRKSYKVEVKLPPTSFDSFSSGLKSLGTLKSMSTSSEDVTYEYIDLEARISNLEKQKERLLAIYEKAETIESIVELETEINRVQTNIDSSIARKNFLERQVSRATLNINLYEEAPIVDTSIVLPLSEATNTLIGSLGFGILLISGLIGFVLPFILLLAIIIVILWVLKKLFFKNIKIPFFGKKK